MATKNDVNEFIHITITGARASGKTRFLREILIPALRRHGCAFHVCDGGLVEDTRGILPTFPKFDVLVTNDPYEAVKHAARERTSDAHRD